MDDTPVLVGSLCGSCALITMASISRGVLDSVLLENSTATRRVLFVMLHGKKYFRFVSADQPAPRQAGVGKLPAPSSLSAILTPIDVGTIAHRALSSGFSSFATHRFDRLPNQVSQSDS